MSFWQVDATSSGIIEDHIISLLCESQDVLVVPRFSSKHDDSSWLIAMLRTIALARVNKTLLNQAGPYGRHHVVGDCAVV